MSGGPLDFEPDDPSAAPAAPATPEPDDADERRQAWGSDPLQTPSTARYSWFVGILALAIIGYITFNTLSTDGPGSRGPRVGRQAPPFSAPLAAGPLNGYVNLAQRTTKDIRTKACDVRLTGALNACDLWRREAVAIVFFVTPSEDCLKEVDVADRLGRSIPGVTVVPVALRAGRGETRRLVARRGWRSSVVYDRDGRMANAYGLAVCPQITYVRRGGVVAGTDVGRVAPAALRARLEALVAGRAITTKGS